jgi:cytochrome c-type biogenesis protein CcmH
MRWLLLLLALAGPVWAVAPDEMLDDAGLEARARAISQGLRCPVCRNETIDESGATVAADLRMLVRERLLAGDSDAQVVAYIVERYGEYVLLRPRANGLGWVLWLAGPGLVLGGGLVVWMTVRRAAGRKDAVEAELSAQERAELARVLGEIE